MPDQEFDLIVIGAGTAGQTVATAAADAGKRVAMTEGRAYGGTCPLRGCDPKLILHAAADALNRVRRLDGKGFTSEPAFDWAQLMEWKRSFTEPIPEKSRNAMQDAGIEVFDGYATFQDAHRVRFGEDGPTAYGHTIVIATGQKPAPLDFPGAEHMLTSDDFLEMEELPSRMVVVGGGYIGSESAHIAQILGCEVTLVVSEEEMLSKFDPDLARLLREAAEERGMTVLRNRKATEVTKSGKTFRVTVEDEDGNTQSLDTDRVLHCAGRVPNIAELKLDRAGVVYDEQKGIGVDDRLRTNVDHIYALGDCSDSNLPLTPVSSHEGKVLAGNLYGDGDRKAEFPPIPTVAFCTPGIAAVGLTAEEADEETHHIRHEETTDWFHARHLNASVYGYKMIVEKDSNKLVGAHLVGPAAAEMINLAAVMIHRGMTCDEIRQTVFAYPTGGSDIASMV